MCASVMLVYCCETHKWIELVFAAMIITQERYYSIRWC